MKLIKFLFLFSFLLLSLFYLTRSGFYEYDSYFALLAVCQPNSEHLENASFMPLEKIVYSFLPCNETILKLITLFLLAIDIGIIYLIGKLENKGLEVVLYSFLTPVLLFETLKFENQIFAIPLMLLGLYFNLKYLKSNKKTDAAIGVIFLLASLGFWGAGIYYLLLFSAFNFIYLIPTLILSFFYHVRIFASFLPRFDVQENFLAWGLLMITFYLVGKCGFATLGSWEYHLKKFEPPFKWITISLIIFGIINPKFFVLGIPLFALATAKFNADLDKKEKLKLLGSCIGVFIIWGATFSSLPIIQNPPYGYVHEAVNDAITLGKSTKKMLANDFEYGHLIWFYGGKTNNHSGPGDKLPDANSIILSRYDYNCSIVKTYDAPLFGQALRLYNC